MSKVVLFSPFQLLQFKIGELQRKINDQNVNKQKSPKLLHFQGDFMKCVGDFVVVWGYNFWHADSIRFDNAEKVEIVMTGVDGNHDDVGIDEIEVTVFQFLTSSSSFPLVPQPYVCFAVSELANQSSALYSF